MAWWSRGEGCENETVEKNAESSGLHFLVHGLKRACPYPLGVLS